MALVEEQRSRSSRDTAEMLTEWVRPDEGLISGHAYADPGVFALEVERIWKKMWLFAGHESEVAHPGDYVTRTVGTVPIIISRTSAGDVTVLLNQCVHRGNLLCTYERGNSSAFKCAYHGWTYRNNGSLLGIPYSSA